MGLDQLWQAPQAARGIRPRGRGQRWVGHNAAAGVVLGGRHCRPGRNAVQPAGNAGGYKLHRGAGALHVLWGAAAPPAAAPCCCCCRSSLLPGPARSSNSAARPRGLFLLAAALSVQQQHGRGVPGPARAVVGGPEGRERRGHEQEVAAPPDPAVPAACLCWAASPRPPACLPAPQRVQEAAEAEPRGC